jgi:hypothetical protein
MDFKELLKIAAVAAALIWASNNVTAVRRIIGR